MQGFVCTYPTLVCEDCKASTPIVSSYAGEIHRQAVNLRSSLAKVAIGESHSSFETFCKKKNCFICISFCTSMPVLANFQIWMLHSEDINSFIHALHLNLSYGSA